MYFLEVKVLIESFSPLFVLQIWWYSFSTLPLGVHRIIFVVEYG